MSKLDSICKYAIGSFVVIRSTKGFVQQLASVTDDTSKGESWKGDPKPPRYMVLQRDVHDWPSGYIVAYELRTSPQGTTCWLQEHELEAADEDCA